MIGILIIAHGRFGESLIECATHVMGSPPPMLEHLGIQTHDDPTTILPKAQQIVQDLNQGDGVLILSDMYGATPCNLVGKLLVQGSIEGVSGVNLPMLVRALTYRNGDILALTEKALSGGREGVLHFTEEVCKGLKK
jgi:PTS system ascorbate-specific IIA component